MPRPVLVTGAAVRIGRELALAFARAGHDVALHYGRSAEAALATADEVRAQGVRCETFQADLAAVEAIAQRKQAEADAAQPKAQRKGDDEMLVGEAKAKPSRRFFGIGRGEEDGPVQATDGTLSRDNRALLQEALFDLLECKRLLDQVR